MIVQPIFTKNNLKIEGQQEYGRMMLDVFWYGFGVQLEKPGVGGVETAVAGFCIYLGYIGTYHPDDSKLGAPSLRSMSPIFSYLRIIYIYIHI
jgi:hypothetical protein